MFLKISVVLGYKLDSTCSGKAPMAGSCFQGNEILWYLRNWEFIDEVSHYQLPNKDYTLRI
jgi:hypothetical protein